MNDTFDSLRQYESLSYHLQYNHYPPVSTDFIPACQQAITYCADEQPDKIIKLPNGKKLTASVVCEGLHLWGYVEQEIYKRSGQYGYE